MAMKIIRYCFSIICFLPFISIAQNYTSYFMGDASDTIVSPLGGICLMGGAKENDNAMRWFLQRANGGDVLVLRTSGSDGYNSYFFNDLGVPIHSVETIVFHNAQASYEPYIIQKIQQAEAIWFAGGNQWTYVHYWRNSPVDSAINHAIRQKNIVVGGTSAGMAILGKYYFTAQNGTVTSYIALSNPFDTLVTIDSISFIQNRFLYDVITDTHFDNPDRKGRLVAFLARIYVDFGKVAKAIACDEYTAVCIDTNGIASVFGDYPNYDDNAYFIQVNCELVNHQPENCIPHQPLTWNLNGLALKAYQIKGNSLGSNSFDLNNWQLGTGGTWYNWSVSNGIFTEQIGTPVQCSTYTAKSKSEWSFLPIYPNPSSDFVNIPLSHLNRLDYTVTLYNSLGQVIPISFTLVDNTLLKINLEGLKNGLYYLVLQEKDGKTYQTKWIKYSN